MTRVRQVLGAAALCALAVSGCATTVTGSGNTSVSPSSTGSSSPDFPSGSVTPSGSATPSGDFPRTPRSTALGDPVTADVCSGIPLSALSGLGYTPTYATSAYPPACSIRMSKDSTIQFTVYVYGVGPNSFSHLAPDSSSGRLVRTGTLSGLTVDYYAYQRETLGQCGRDVLADGATLAVGALGRADQHMNTEKAHCAAADAAAKAVARAAAARSFTRLQLASPTVSSIDFCAALRKTTTADLPVYQKTVLAADGIGDGCQLTRGTAFYVYLDFGVSADPLDGGAAPSTIGGHRVFGSDTNDDSYCYYTSVQGRTPDGRRETVSISASDFTDSAADRKGLCKSTGTVLARFLDVAGLT